MKKLNSFDWIAATLLVIGGLNWGLIGFFGINLVEAIFGEMSLISRIIYALVGLSSAYALFMPSRMSSGEFMHGEPMKGGV